MLTTRHGHSFIGPLSGVVVDVGCYGYDFATAALQAGARRVLAFDLEDLSPPLDERIVFQHSAVTGIGGPRRYVKEAKRNAWRLSPIGTSEIQGVSLQQVMQEHGITEIELLKLDCEGSEFEILENLPDNVKQISVEFHLHVWPEMRKLVQYCMERLSVKYDVIQHRITRRHAKDKPNYWDTLLVRKPC